MMNDFLTRAQEHRLTTQRLILCPNESTPLQHEHPINHEQQASTIHIHTTGPCPPINYFRHIGFVTRDGSRNRPAHPLAEHTPVDIITFTRVYLLRNLPIWVTFL
jgi:hypothetical protein